MILKNLVTGVRIMGVGGDADVQESSMGSDILGNFADFMS